MARLLLIICLIFVSEVSFGNSCCGQSPASFSVLSLDQTLSITASYSYIQSQGRVYGNSKEFYVWNDKKREIQSLQLNLASVIRDRQQLFLAASVLQGSYEDSFEKSSSQNLSDTQFGYTYEVLPEYSFSYWKPIVYLSFLATIPTGKSIYDNTLLSEGAGVTGHNQWGAGFGVTLKKVYFPVTVTFQTKILKIFSKQFENIRVSDFYDSSVALLSNYATPYWQVALNLGLTFSHLSKRTIQPSNTSSGIIQNSTVLIGLQRPLGDSWSVGVNYADQTLVGRAQNTILNKTYNFNFNYNYF